MTAQLVELFGDEVIRVGDIVVFQEWECKVENIIDQQFNGHCNRLIEFIDEHTGEHVVCDEQFDCAEFYRYKLS